ncbi:uncharacterized protein DDB_G0283357-like isoform X2 [Contarinia nasturtii]|uniref:uncharacterized protein DDB_G0283357-like isoform X2 n=1 Tax=Contarinia nasturtii TaxID=265458 RepID=UPI0012D43659|nr:uncharacterized protein DDB_G0283357-like isoform X2 [Contarinia nasturtii]
MNWHGNTLDTRPLNPVNQNKIRQMFARENLDTYNLDGNSDSDHSVDACLDDTGVSELVGWAVKKNKGTNLDPEIRKRPVKVSNSPLSDYNVEWTRMSHTSDSFTPSSLSNLSLPSNPTNRSWTFSTPQQNRRSRTSSRTPAAIVRDRMRKSVDRIRSPRRTTKFKGDMIPNTFLPTNFSTPVGTNKKRASVFATKERHTEKADNDQEVSSSNGDAHEKDARTRTMNSSDKTLTNDSNKNNEPVSTSIRVPETQPNDTIVPETQPNDTAIPETQPNETVIPETQENEIPDSQNDHENNPVQAQVTQQNTDQQAAPRSNNLVYSTQKLQPHPSIRDKSPMTTPSKYVPSSTTPGRNLMSRTPSRIPVSKIFRGIVHTPRSNIGDATPASSKNGGWRHDFIVVQTPTANQQTQPISTPATVVPPQNVTINVNVSNSHPQTSQPSQQEQQQTKQTTHTIRTNNPLNENGPNAENGSNDSILTNDSNSNDGHKMINSDRSNTPILDRGNISARRKLFPKDDPEQSRRDGTTFNKIDNLTRTITGDSIASPMRTRQRNSNLSAKSVSSIMVPSSQTFVKPKTSIQNATYDVATENGLAQPSNDIPNVGMNSTENSQALTSSSHTGGDTYSINDAANLPSEAFLEPIADDEGHENDVALIDRNDEQPSVNERTSQLNQTNSLSKEFNPVVKLNRISMRNSTRKTIGDSTENISNLHASKSYIQPPPFEFQNDDDLIKEGSPQTSLRNFNEQQNQSLGLNSNSSRVGRKRIPKKKNEDLEVFEKNIEKIKHKEPSKKPTPRQLRSTIFEDDDETVDENIETTKSSKSSSAANDSVFKVPSAPAVRVSKSRSINVTKNNSVNANQSVLTISHGPEQQHESQQEEQEMEHEPINVEPMDEDEFIENNEPSTTDQSVQKEPSPKRKQKAQPKVRTNATKKTNQTTAKAKKQVDIAPENEVTSTEVPTTMRRSGRDVKANSLQQFRNELYSSVVSKPTTKRKSREPVRHTAPVVTFQNEFESEPPRKKPRAQSEMGHKRTKRPSNSTHSSSKSTKSMKLSTIKESHEKAEKHRNDITPFQEEIPMLIKKKTLSKEDWWKGMLNLKQKDPIIHSIKDTDAEHINNRFGQIEISSTDKISYMERDGVDYGFIPSASRQTVGFMRFRSGASKVKGPSHEEVELHVLKGEFLIECDDTTMDAFAGCDITVPKGVSYGLKNVSDDIGIIQCTYALSMS